MNPARLKAYLLLIVVTAIWGIATPIIKFTLQGFAPEVFLTYRFAISSILALATSLFIGFRLPKNIGVLLKLILYGFLSTTVTLGLLFFGLNNTTVLESSLITLIDPLLISLAGVYFLREHVTKRERIGIFIALFGTTLTIVEPLLETRSGTAFTGNVLILGYVMTTALCAVMAKQLLRQKVDALTLTNFSFIIGFLTMLPFALTKITTSNFAAITSVPTQYHLGVLFMALISGSFAYYLANKAQKSIEIGEQAIFGYLYPVFSTPLAVFWLGEKVTPIVVIGAIVVAIGVFIAETKKR